MIILISILIEQFSPVRYWSNGFIEVIKFIKQIWKLRYEKVNCLKLCPYIELGFQSGPSISIVHFLKPSEMILSTFAECITESQPESPISFSMIQCWICSRKLFFTFFLHLPRTFEFKIPHVQLPVQCSPPLFYSAEEFLIFSCCLHLKCNHPWHENGRLRGAWVA